MSGLLRHRCWDPAASAYAEPHGRVCSPSAPLIGRGCPVNTSCIDSAYPPVPYGVQAGVFKSAEALALEPRPPFYVAAGGGGLEPIHANPPFSAHFDTVFWSLLSVFTVWGGVDWTSIMYYMVDAAGSAWELLFILIYVVGAWFLINLMIAVLGDAFSRDQVHEAQKARETARLRELFAEKRKVEDTESFVGKARVLTRSLTKKLTAVGGAADHTAMPARGRGRLSAWHADEARVAALAAEGPQSASMAIVTHMYFKTLVVVAILASAAVASMQGPFYV